MMVVRKDSRQHIQELCVALDNGLWFPERQQQAVRDDLQALSQAQDALCQALAQVQIATADKADELGERIEAWHREQENREAMKAMVHQLEGIFDVAYVGTDESIASQFRQMQGDVKALLGLSLTFDELSARAEKYIRFLEAVHFDGPLLDRDLADSLRSQFGSDICFSEILITWQRIHQERKQITLPARVKSKCDTDRTEAVILHLSFPRKIP